MQRSPTQRYHLYAAWLFGVAPIVFGLLQATLLGDDYVCFRMALAPSFFVAGLLAASIGQRRTRKAVRVQSISIFIGSTILSVITGLLFGATGLAGVVGYSAMFGAMYAIASILVARSRAREH